MKKREYMQSKTKKILFRFKGFLFLFLLCFSICLIFISNMLTSRLGTKQVNENEILLEYMTASLPTNADDLFYEYIDNPMEQQFNSSALTNFYFSTNNYPIEDELLPYLESSLTAYVDNSNYISGAVVYASTTNTYVSSLDLAANSNIESKTFLDDMIYGYNSNTLERTQISGRKSNTFLFKYKNQIVFSKDLTTLAGTPHAIMFVFLDMEQFASSIYHSIASVAYEVSIYDSYNNLLFSNSTQKQTEVDQYLSRLSTGETSIEQAGSHNFIYCQSNILRFQYILKVEKNALSRDSTHPVLFYGITACVIILFSLLIVIITFAFWAKPTAKIFASFTAPELQTFLLPSRTFAILSQQVAATVQENLTLRKIVAATSSEAITSLFSRLIAGQKIEDEETKITLNNTDYGFHPNDIYIAGILYHSGQDFIRVESRYRILHLLNVTFKEYKEKNDLNICAFLYDEKTIAIIASFISGTSIAKGKAKINTLKEQINETLSYSNVPLMIAFGNMYSSILDLAFSYNEAFRGIHYMVEAASAVTTASPMPISQSTQVTASTHTATEKELLLEKSDFDGEVLYQDFLELIYRRAEQIAKLVWDEKSELVQSLISRTIEDIIQSDTLTDQTNNCKRLVSAVTSHMLSYPFVSDTHLSDVYNQLTIRLKEDGLTSAILNEVIQNALLILCEDFSAALKKQRNPYIMTAQEYIAQNYSNPELTLEAIAEKLKIAPNYLSTIFSKNLGKRLFEYINEYRLEKSIELLLNTTQSINDISVASGFGSSRNYIRIFKKHKGVPPGAYRKQQHEQPTVWSTEEDDSSIL